MQNVDYVTVKDAPTDAASVTAEDAFEDGIAPPSPMKKPSRRKKQVDSESDTDFQAATEDESEPEAEPADPQEAARELDAARGRSTTTIANSSQNKQDSADALNNVSSKSPAKPGVTVKSSPAKAPALSPPQLKVGKVSVRNGPPPIIDLTKPQANAPATIKPFKRAHLPLRSPLEPTYGSYSNRVCPACHKLHPQGACELKEAGVEHCNLCGMAHYGQGRTCPHIKSETQVRAMLQALKNSPEPRPLVDAALKYLRGVKGTLVQAKKKNVEKAAALKGGGNVNASGDGDSALALPKPRAPGTFKPYVPQSQQFPNGPPQHETPAWYKGPDTPQSVAEQQRFAQLQAHMQAQGQMDEGAMESALRGFLGH